MWGPDTGNISPRNEIKKTYDHIMDFILYGQHEERVVESSTGI